MQKTLESPPRSIKGLAGHSTLGRDWTMELPANCIELQDFSFQDPCWDEISGDAIAFVSNLSHTLLLAAPIRRHIVSPSAIIYFGLRQAPLLR